MVFSCYRGWPLPVDFLGGFEINVDGAWRTLPLPAVVRLGAAAVPVAALADLIDMHHLFDRPKDQARIARLAALTT